MTAVFSAATVCCLRYAARRVGGDTANYRAEKGELSSRGGRRLNTADALGAVYMLVKDIKYSGGGRGAKKVHFSAMLPLWRSFGVLGLLYDRKQEQSLDSEAEALIEQRTAARKARFCHRRRDKKQAVRKWEIVLYNTCRACKWSRK